MLIDAVFADPRHRTVIADVARTVGVPFTGLWLEAPAGVRSARVTDRRDDVSDATQAVLREQLGQDVGESDWARLDAAADATTPVASSLQLGSHPLALTQHPQQIAAPELRDLRLGVTTPHQLERHVEGFTGVVPPLNPTAAVEV